MQTSDAWRALKPPKDRYQTTRASSDDPEKGETVGVVDRADSGCHHLNGLEAKDEVIGSSNDVSWVIFSRVENVVSVRGQIDDPGKHICRRSDHTGAPGSGGRPDSGSCALGCPFVGHPS